MIFDGVYKNKFPITTEVSLACSTCHIILEKKFLISCLNLQKRKDMLDLAWDLRICSRLGCQDYDQQTHERYRENHGGLQEI